MEEWDPAINDFVLVAGGQTSNLLKLSVPQEKSTIVKSVWAFMFYVTANPNNNPISVCSCKGCNISRCDHLPPS